MVLNQIRNNKIDPKDIPDLIESIFSRIVALDSSSAEPVPEQEAMNLFVNKSDTASSGAKAKLAAENASGLIVADPPFDADTAGADTGFDAPGWLNSLPERNIYTDSEAYRANPNLKKGWVGAYDNYIICLIDGKPVRILTSHLKRYYKDDPRGASLSAYRAYFRLPPDYPASAKEFQEKKSKSIENSHKKEDRGSPIRADDVNDQILASLNKAEADPHNQIKASTCPGLFSDFIVCLECGSRTTDIFSHLEKSHENISISKYIKKFSLSSRYPRYPRKVR